jgi:hypothetical protein
VKYCKVCSLSPLMAPAMVKPAANLFRHVRAAQRPDVDSAKTWKAAEAVPMYVGAPKTMASAASSSAHCESSIRSTEITGARAPVPSTPVRTASARTAVCPEPE